MIAIVVIIKLALTHFLILSPQPITPLTIFKVRHCVLVPSIFNSPKNSIQGNRKIGKLEKNLHL